MSNNKLFKSIMVLCMSASVFIICILMAFVFIYKDEADSNAFYEKMECELDNIESSKLIPSNSDQETTNTINSFYNVNHYYNISTKVCDGKTLVETPEGIYVTDKSNTSFEKVTDGDYYLGAVVDDGVYLCECVTNNFEEHYNLAFFDIDDYSITRLVENVDISDSEGYSQYIGMHIEGKHLDIEGTKTFSRYLLGPEHEADLEGVYRDLTNHYYPIVAVLDAHINNAYMTDRTESIKGNLQIETSEGKKNTIEGVSDVLLTPYGALLRKVEEENNNIFLVDYATGDERIIYNSKINGDKYVGYNTYDNNGFYGLQIISEKEYAIIFCNWEGDIKEIYRINSDNTLLGSTLNMSIVGKWLYFYDVTDFLMKRIKIDEPYLIETIKEN